MGTRPRLRLSKNQINKVRPHQSLRFLPLSRYVDRFRVEIVRDFYQVRILLSINFSINQYLRCCDLPSKAQLHVCILTYCMEQRCYKRIGIGSICQSVSLSVSWKRYIFTRQLFTSGFLYASSYLYMRLRPSVRRPVGPSVRWSVRRSVSNTFFRNLQNALLMIKNDWEPNEYRHGAL